MKIIRRYQWKSLPPKEVFYYYHTPKIITLHDSDRDSKRSIKTFIKTFKGGKTVRDIQKSHIYEHGLIDIGYHYIIHHNGDIYECRPDTVVGCMKDEFGKYKNSNGNIQIMLVGNFDVESPSREQVQSLLDLLEYINSRFNYMEIPECIRFKNIGGDKNKLLTLIKYIKVKTKEIKNGI